MRPRPTQGRVDERGGEPIQSLDDEAGARKMDSRTANSRRGAIAQLQVDRMAEVRAVRPNHFRGGDHLPVVVTLPRVAGEPSADE